MSKQQVIKVTVFITLFFVILIPLTYILRTSGDVKERFAGFYAEEKNSIDVITIGSSPVFPYYSAPKMWGEKGIAMYPLSTNLQRPLAMLPLVKEALKTQQPKLFVFEMRMFTIPDEVMCDNMAYTRGVTDNMKYSWNRVETIRRMVPKEEKRYTYYFDIFKYHSNWKTLVLKEQLLRYDYTYPSMLKGYVFENQVGPSEMTDFSSVTTRVPLPKEQEKTLRELLNFLKESKQEALFIVSPFTMTEEKQGMFLTMADIVSEYGYSFCNFNDYYEKIGIDFGTDFYDYGGHTNALGAEKCTTFLQNYIKEHYDIEDKRGQEGYESYDESYSLWSEMQKSALETIDMRIQKQDYAPVPGQE